MIEYIFVSTSDIYSGHEKLFFKAAMGTSKTTTTIFLINKKNKQGIAELKKNGSFVDIIEFDFGRDLFESFRVWFRWFAMFKLTLFFSRIKPRKIVVGQGRIEGGAVAVLAAKLTGIPCSSYLPMAHSHVEMSGDSFISKIKDFLSKKLYSLPSNYIVISNAVKESVIEKTNKKNISVVENYTNFISDAAESDILNEERIHILVLGRISFRHKCQDELVKVIYDNRILLNNNGIHVNIVGDGPDMPKLIEMISSYEISDLVSLSGYSYDAINTIKSNHILLIPSRYEGVPLTMIEAAKLNRVIFGRNIDGVKDYLEDDYIFDDIKDFLHKIVQKKYTGKNYKKSLEKLILRSEDDFVSDFLKVISK